MEMTSPIQEETKSEVIPVDSTTGYAEVLENTSNEPETTITTNLEAEEVHEPGSAAKIPYVLQYDKYDTCTKEDVEECYNEVKDFNKLEALRYYTRVKSEIDSCNMAEEFIATAVATKETAMNLVNILDESTKTILGDETESLKSQLDNADDFDQDKFKKELELSRNRLLMAADLIRAHIAHLKEVNGDTNMAEDIIDTLLKNRKTISEGSDLNKDTYCKAIDDAIIEITNIGLSKFDEKSLRRIVPKLQNEKRIRDLYKDMKDKNEFQKLFNKVGFNTNFIASFIHFMDTEMKFYTHELDGSPLCDKPTLITASTLFFYHVARIVDAELHKKRYRTLVFKLYALRPLEVDKAYPVSEFKDNTMVTIPRWIEEGVTQTESSEFRQTVFHAYEKILAIYIKALPNIDKESAEVYNRAIEKQKKKK